METDVTAAALSLPIEAQSHKDRRHNRHKKASDPFLEIEDDAIKLPDQPSPNDDSNRDGKATAQSMLADLVLTPISMIALLLSLFVVDHEQRKWRLSQHATHPESLWAKISAYLDPEPYGRSHDQSSQDGATDGALSYLGWYRRKKHRAMAKLELGDALEMRGRVVVALAAWCIFGMLMVIYAVRRLFAWSSD